MLACSMIRGQSWGYGNMQLYAGSSGFSYKEWKGPFYPEKLPAAKMLEFYAEQLPSVEINNTFYRMPRRELLEGWVGRVPANFRFAVKASRQITHFKKLQDCGEAMGFFVKALAGLDDRLGPVLFQLPPNLSIDVGRLSAFLELIPDTLRAAFEFRHESWVTAAVADLLAARNHTMVWADTDKLEVSQWPDSGQWFYLRLRRQGYDEEQLSMWLGRLRDAGAKRAYVYFKHEDKGAAPALARQLIALSSN